MKLRSTYAHTEHLQYRLRAAGALLGVTDNTIRGYADNAGITVKRASDITPGAPSVRVFEPDTLFRIAQWRRQQGYVKGPSTGPTIITVDVIKGGTGKTTTSVETALHLQLLGLKVLLVDLDIQANATQLMGYEPDLTVEEAEAYGLALPAIVTETFSNLILPFLEAKNRGVVRVTTGELTNVIKKPFGDFGPHLIPADTFLGDVETALANSKGQRELYIRQFITAANEGKIPFFETSKYDVIIFDCPPSVSFTSTAALAAADIVIAPIRLDAFSVKGLTKLMSEINALDEAYQVRPELVILPTHYAPQFARIGRMQAQITQYHELLAPNVISATEEFPKSLDNYLPLTLQKPTSNGAKEYKLFAEYIHSKILAKSSAKKAAKS